MGNDDWGWTWSRFDHCYFGDNPDGSWNYCKIIAVVCIAIGGVCLLIGCAVFLWANCRSSSASSNNNNNNNNYNENENPNYNNNGNHYSYNTPNEGYVQGNGYGTPPPVYYANNGGAFSNNNNNNNNNPLAGAPYAAPTSAPPAGNYYGNTNSDTNYITPLGFTREGDGTATGIPLQVEASPKKKV
ncbi:hypothetical protein ADEAN_000634500 [Angomonas deanei]|uniref:Uncharacterized protein n=1 Tax=Angomonas deanei TaxID=59799 RepID=A0A7G2CKV6_9TRYP|nr:hypothetical protein ADEAN_000634500 [Angomonas deanei]